MPPRILILGGGTGGTIAANRLDRALGDRAAITVVDQDGDHLYQPGLLFLPFGQMDSRDLVRPRSRQLRHRVDYVQAQIESVDVQAKLVHLSGGRNLSYDILVVATGSRLVPEETEGLTGPGWNDTVFTFYAMEGAKKLREALERFQGGTLVVNVVDMPIKCPVAPLEFSFLADAFFRSRGIRDKVELVYATPLDGVFTKPIASRHLMDLLRSRSIRVETEFNTGSVDGAAKLLTSYDGREIPFDLAGVIPLHAGAEYLGRSPGLGDELGFIPTDPHTLQAKAGPDIFVIGDAAGLPVSKAGSVAHFEGEVLVENIKSHLAGRSLTASFDGHANCFIETGGGKAVLIDFNYDLEPVPGHFPTRVGLPLLKESRLNHVAKHLFEWFYWHELLPGREIPGMGPDMPRAGKELPEQTAAVSAAATDH